MSELKAFDIVVAEEGYCEGIVKYRRAVYDKSEADKVIADLESRIPVWRSWKDDPPKFPDSEGFVFCGHQKYDWETEMRYFVDVGHLDVDGTLCMYNDWDEGEQVFEVDYWFPLPKHPEEKETK